jgi:hypothetical protein
MRKRKYKLYQDDYYDLYGVFVRRLVKVAKLKGYSFSKVWLDELYGR